MAIAYKVLGQSAPSATTNTDVYTVPASTEAVVSSIVVAERGGASADVRIAVRPSGAAISSEHYVFYDVTVAANTAEVLTAGISLEATDVVTVYSSTADVSFNVFGTEIS